MEGEKNSYALVRIVFCLVLVSSGQNACAQITAASCLSRVVKAPVLKLRPFISLVLSVPKDKYLEGRLFLLNSSHCKAI